ncbi:MAG TPA: hypothetical protein VJZ71_10165 [Phycisphaerae bacterium]|nr:hypothetical protein [Phycisphaerae bacterium]
MISLGYFTRCLFSADEGARRDARDAKRDASVLEERLDRLTLMSAAMWSLLSERLGVVEDELVKRVQELDLSDGKLDGKIGLNIGECPKCRRQLSKRHRRCLYCGHELPASFSV